MASIFLCFLFFSSLLLTLTSSSPSITLSLSPILNPNSSSNPWEFITHITKSTIARAHHLKNPSSSSSSSSSSVLHGTEKAPLFPRSYGGYSVSLSFGNPPQPIPLVFDTGSSLVWVPCTSRYLCSNCTFSHVDPTKIPTFMPKLSSSTRIVGCLNPYCDLLFGSDVGSHCPGCSPTNCSQPCPSYLIQYGLGATSGLAVLDYLDLPGKAVPDFVFGCSVISERQPEGIAGFGRAPSSLPNQLGLKKFSYCLLSHNFNDKPRSSDLILAGDGKISGEKGVTYTPLGKNPAKSPYNEYYYIELQKITVGKKRVKLPNGILLRPGPNGNGGTIVDSGSTLTFMERAAFDPLVAEFAAQTGQYKRALEAEAGSGFGFCLDVTKEQNITLPELVFHFKGGAKMELPTENYMSFFGDTAALCLTIVSGLGPSGPKESIGPGMILGNYQQQNFYIEYDLENQRLGIKKEPCS